MSHALGYQDPTDDQVATAAALIEFFRRYACRHVYTSRPAGSGLVTACSICGEIIS